MVFFFSGFALDPDRGELRGPDGVVLHLRPKTFELLRLLTANSHRLLTKQELLDAIWPGVHVGEDSLFQCIREIRTALGDHQRQMVKLVSGRGYLLAVDVATNDKDAPASEAFPLADEVAPHPPIRRRSGLPRGYGAALVVFAILAAGIFAAAAYLGLFTGRLPPSEPTIQVLPFVTDDKAPESAALAKGISAELIGGLASIDGMRIVVSPDQPVPGFAEPAAETKVAAPLVLRGTLQRDAQSWKLQVRLSDAQTQEIKTVAEAAVDTGDASPELLKSRLAAGVGYKLALRLNALEAGTSTAENDPARVAIQQAAASINQTTRERFATARTILEKYRSEQPDDVDVQVALAALHLRAIQMSWYRPTEERKAENDARDLLETAMRSTPNSAPVLGTYCRFLTATNRFTESLVACARTLAINPWDGAALFQLGLTQAQLGRFDDALNTFLRADRFGTPEVSRWTWLLGAGFASLLLERNEEAVQWLQRSIAVTPASGRTYMLLAVGYQRLGRLDEARDALHKGMALRPGSTALNIALPTRNASETYLTAARKIGETLVGLGLPRDGTP